VSNLGLSICVFGYDTENIKQALSRTENGKLDFGSLISGLFTVMPKGSFESIGQAFCMARNNYNDYQMGDGVDSAYYGDSPSSKLNQVLFKRDIIRMNTFE